MHIIQAVADLSYWKITPLSLSLAHRLLGEAGFLEIGGICPVSSVTE